MAITETEFLQQVADTDYKYGWETPVEADVIPKGINEDIVRMISAKKEEPEWLLEWRLKAFHYWKTLAEDRDRYPRWAHIRYPTIDFQDITYYASPTRKPRYESLDEVDPELLETFERLGIPLKIGRAHV